MSEYTSQDVEAIVKNTLGQSLEALLREGARKMLQAALEMEVETYLAQCQAKRDQNGHRQVVRNGHHRERELVSGLGKIAVRQPRVDDRRAGHQFTSAILPKYMRRLPSIDQLIPALYLKGLSTSCFPEALKAILGEQVSGLSPANIVRLKAIWETEFADWQKRDLHGKPYVYVGADGIYFGVRLSADRPCMLVLIGATSDGRKELIGLLDGHRERKLSWQTLLQGLKARGLSKAPAIAVGEGALGFWAALREEWPATWEQRCWVHKTANVPDKLPKRLQPDAKTLLHNMYLSPTKKEALEAYERFLTLYGDKYPKACECLIKDKEVLFTFYAFPAAHGPHLRTTNPIESTFGTVRHRTPQTKGCGSRMATMTMVFKLAIEAQKKWQRLHSHKWLEKVIAGVQFVDGEMKSAA